MKFKLPLSLVLSTQLAFLSVSVSAHAQATTAAKARDHYNAGQYREAAAAYLLAVQETPKEATLYRDLARAKIWVDDLETAIVAYRFYLLLRPLSDDRQKIEAELAHALKQVRVPPPEGPPAVTAALVARAQVKAASGDFTAAVTQVAEALARGYIDPDLEAEREKVLGPLAAAYAKILEAFWAESQVASDGDLARLIEAYDALVKVRAAKPSEATAAAACRGLFALRGGDPTRALEALSPVAGSDFRLRFAQAVALMKLGRHDEAAQALSALEDQSPRVKLLRGLAEQGAGRDGSAQLKAALGL